MQVEPNGPGCDVTHRQLEENKTNLIFSTAVRSTKTDKPNGRIYTSTPKTSHPHQKVQNYVGSTEPTEKGRVGVVTAFDPLLKKVALLFGALIIAYKSVILTSKCVKLRAILWVYRVPIYLYIPLEKRGWKFKVAIVGGDVVFTRFVYIFSFINS